MVTFLNILISSSIIPISDLVLSHDSSRDVQISTSPPVPKSHIILSHISSCYDPNINFSCPKKHIVLSYNSSQRNQKLTSPVPKNHFIQSQNLSCYDHKSTSPVPKSDLVLSHISSHYDIMQVKSLARRSCPNCSVHCQCRGPRGAIPCSLSSVELKNY
jgi:hypothetical protein